MSVILAVFTVTGAIGWALTALVVAGAALTEWSRWLDRRARRSDLASEVVAGAEKLLRDVAGGQR